MNRSRAVAIAIICVALESARSADVPSRTTSGPATNGSGMRSPRGKGRWVMRSSVATAAARTHANPLRTSPLDALKAGESNVRMGANSVEKAPEFRHNVREAMRRVGLTQKEMAIVAGVPESDISAGLNGDRRFDGQWARCQSPAFRRALRQVEDEADGVDPTAMRREGFEDFVAMARAFWFRHERREERAQ